MTSRFFYTFGAALILLASLPGWSQETPAAPVPAVTGISSATPGTNDSMSTQDTERMATPPPVSGGSYPVSFTSEGRSNYLRGGVTFSSAYSDNVLGSTASGHPVSDVSYSVWPTVAIDQSVPRLHWVLSYAPGFTFYQRTSSYNEADQNLSVDFQYRLSPHVTLSARDGFEKSSSVFNQPDLGATPVVSGGIAEPNQSVIAPIADRLSNNGSVGISYQFAANGMVGASGAFSNLHYPNQNQVPGLFDAESQGGSAFYALRVSKMHYFGAAYQYQRLLSFPTAGTNVTQTHAVLAFYTLYLNSRFSISAFGGPQYADIGLQYSTTGAAALAGSRSWNPAAGASLSWQAGRSSLAISYARMVSSGGGLIGAVKSDSASASIRQQLLPRLSGGATASYAQNDLLAATPLISGNGHTISGTATLQQQFGQHLNLQLGYTRLHQDYGSVAVLAATPNTNREFISLSYQFARPLGR